MSSATSQDLVKPHTHSPSPVAPVAWLSMSSTTDTIRSTSLMADSSLMTVLTSVRTARPDATGMQIAGLVAPSTAPSISAVRSGRPRA